MNIMLGLAKGLEDNAYLSNRVANNVANKVKDGMTTCFDRDWPETWKTLTNSIRRSRLFSI